MKKVILVLLSTVLFIFYRVALLVALLNFVFLATMTERLHLQVGGKVQQDFFTEVVDADKMTYLKENEKALESTKIGDTYFLGFAKAITHTTGNIWIDAYMVSPNQNCFYTVESISMVARDGTLVYEANACDFVITPASPGIDKSKGVLLLTYEISDEWYYKGNTLSLRVEIEANGEMEILTFPIEVVATYSPPYL